MTAGDIQAREFLRHTIATLAYRGGKAVRGAPAGFEQYRLAGTSRTPGEVLAHICDLLDWMLGLLQGRHEWKEAPPRSWDADVKRFFEGLQRVDAFLASPERLGFPPGRLFQGPVADALTHVGQIAMLRRAAGSPIRGENYFKAGIRSGDIGPAQPEPEVEFD